ncbi:MAG: DUF4198 domain-containing protein [Acidobacteria bacterium]|nr:DUF4198 domain-containing protein [Acidobacteriota bacterium]NIQ30685.1 DUF4198 domain-containing protein [Acidobacteriota bacterium]NIQ85643.1 DUF4198 domain-containing protein [Acidobacteriota bacterium]
MSGRRFKVWLRRATLAATLAIIVPVQSRAHDYWFAQQPPIIDVGDTCVLRLLVGDGLRPELERPLQREITTRFEWLTTDGPVDLMEQTAEDAQPVLQRKVAGEGTALVVMDRDFVPTEGTYERFVGFLEHEGALELLRDVESVPRDTTVRRRYARNLKALVRVGDGGDRRLHGRRVGQDLEILLLDDPWSVKPGAELKLRILFRGKPVEGLPIKSLVDTGRGSITESHARTDANGVAGFRLEHRGQWLIRATLIRPSDDRTAADWDTYYSTYSFMLPAP